MEYVWIVGAIIVVSVVIMRVRDMVNIALGDTPSPSASLSHPMTEAEKQTEELRV